MNTIDLVKDSTLQDIAFSLRALSGIGMAERSTLKQIQQIVRAGKAAELLRIGDVITVPNSLYGDVRFEIIGMDAEKLVNPLLEHSITLLPVEALGCSSIPVVQFDAPETSTATGTFKSGTNYYRSDSSSPSGYRLLNEGTDYSVGASISETVYANSIRDTTGYIVKHGCNIWAYSNVRQWLNSGKTGAWWTASHVGDMKPSYADTVDGFMSYFDDEFIDCLAKVKKHTVQNSVVPNLGVEDTEDYFFLLSTSELWGEEFNTDATTTQGTSDEGTIYEIYSQGASRIKQRMDTGNNVAWTLRSANTTDTYQVHRAHTNGYVNTMSKAYLTFGFCPACVIA